MEIKSISQKIFRSAPQNTENRSSQTNPFGASFNGTILKADVFSSSASVAKKSQIIDKVSNRSKMVMSTIVGSFGAFNQKISSRLNSVVNFGRNIKSKASDAWRYLSNKNASEALSETLGYLNDTKVFMHLGKSDSKPLLEIKLPDTTYKSKNLSKLSIAELEPMFKNLADETVRLRGAA